MPRRLPFTVVTKPTGAACNLNCTYCFFLSKEKLYPHDTLRMSPAVQERYIRAYLAAQPDGDVTLTWQGGEPTLMGLDFFRRACELVRRYARPRQRVQQSIQTNGVLVTDEWAAFFAREGFLVGLSMDGPADIHDTYRVNKAGRGTYGQVVRGWEALQRQGAEVNILCTVHAGNQNHSLEVYRHFRDDLGAKYMQFIPIVERVLPEDLELANQGWVDGDGGTRLLYLQHGDAVTERSVNPAAYGRFLSEIFAEWIAHDVGTVFVQDVDVALSAMFGQYTLCVHAPECGGALAVEHNGDVYSCDHYVEPDYRLGSVLTDDFADLLCSPSQRSFGRGKRTDLPSQCLRCSVRPLCHGGCPKDRFIDSEDGEPGLNYLCAGYRHFYETALPGLRAMARLVASGREAREVMTS